MSRSVEEGESYAGEVVIERDRSLIDSIVDAPPPPRGQEMRLGSGRKIVAEPGERGDVVRIESASGEVELQITMTESGPLLSFRAADVRLASEGTMRLDCKRLDVRAEEGIRHATGGNLEEVVHGDKVSRVKGTSAALARRTLIESKRGDVKLVANDDIQLLGERVKLNC